MNNSRSDSYAAAGVDVTAGLKESGAITIFIKKSFLYAGTGEMPVVTGFIFLMP